ncbi:MAG: hypothetical protein WA154_12260 [Moraxellaceae bacterium]
MNAINESMNPDNAKKHNPRIPYIAAANMGKRFMDLFLQELKAAPDVWQKQSAKQQSEVIDRVRKGIEYATAGAVNTIVTGGHTALAGTIDTVNIKDKIKLTVIVSKSNLSESLAELYAAGSESSCQILLADAAQYCGGMDLIEADPDQPALFGNEPELPDDQLLWAVNVPMLTGATIAPAPSRKDAELYARSIREKLIDLDRTEFATNVYALPWPMNRGEHMRSYNKGNWEALINWFSQLCAGEVEVKPVALIGHSPEEVEQAESEKMTMHYDRMTVRMVDGEFKAESSGEHEGGAKVSGFGKTAEDAIQNLIEGEDVTGTFTLKDESTPADELAGRRVIDVYLTFDPLAHPELVMEANMQNNVGMGFDQVVEEILHEVDYKPTDGFALIEPIQPEAAADDHIKIYFEPSSKFLTVQGRTTTQPSKAQALRCGKAVMFGAKDCMFEYTGSEKIGNMLCETYEARLLLELTEEQPRIKVSYSPINGGVYRATCNSRSSTSTSTARSAVNNLLKKMDVAGQVVEITTLDDIEREVQMFTVIA